MNASGPQLLGVAEEQIDELIALLTRVNGGRRFADPCLGREKLGDGTIGAVCSHVADIYMRIADFVELGQSEPPAPHGRSPVPAPKVLIAQLTAARRALIVVQELNAATANAVPEAGAIRFADGERTLSQVLFALLRHQRHQVDAISASLPDPGSD